MFTGLIEHLGRVVKLTARAGASRIAIESDLVAEGLKGGESVAVDGACLTVARRSGRVFEADVVEETLGRTTLGRLRAGDSVHLERSLAVGDRLGGHLVSGHVDAVLKVRSLRRLGGDVKLTLELPAALRRFVAEKGSITLHGVSLTVARARAASFEVALIPETLSRTKLGALRPGQGLNVEVDLIARYLDGLIGARRR